MGSCVTRVGRRHPGKGCSSILARLASTIFCRSVLARYHGGVNPRHDVGPGCRQQAVARRPGIVLAVQHGMRPPFRPAPGRAGVAVPGCRGALMPGYAFSIDDALIANRWAEQILSRGYRVLITPRYKDAEEIIEVYIPGAKTPTFRVHRTPHSVLITDCIGLTLSFSTLVDALLAIVPLSKSGRQQMLKGADPPWLPRFPACPTTKPGGVWLHPGRFMARITASAGESASRTVL